MVWWITHFYCWNNSAHDTSSYRYGKCYLMLVMQTSVKPSSQKCCRCFVRVLPVKTIVLDNVRFHHSAQVAQLFPKSGLFQATFPHSLHTIIQPNRECVLKVEECCVSDALQEWRWAAASNCISSWYHHRWRHPCLLSRCNRDLCGVLLSSLIKLDRTSGDTLPLLLPNIFVANHLQRSWSVIPLS